MTIIQNQSNVIMTLNRKGLNATLPETETGEDKSGFRKRDWDQKRVASVTISKWQQLEPLKVATWDTTSGVNKSNYYYYYNRKGLNTTLTRDWDWKRTEKLQPLLVKVAEKKRKVITAGAWKVAASDATTGVNKSCYYYYYYYYYKSTKTRYSKIQYNKLIMDYYY